MSDAQTAFFPGESDKAPVLMLHGTGGDETDLLPIASFLAPDSPKLGIRGRIHENGANRYFKHTDDGGFDLDNLSTETDWLLSTIVTESAKHGIDPKQLLVLGFSNGANVAAYAWLHKKAPFKTAILLHPMMLDPQASAANLNGVATFLTHGDVDPIVSSANFTGLRRQLTDAGAAVEAYTGHQSHQLTRAELSAAKTWLDKTGRLVLSH
ncbi:hypothetical protein FC96_GL002371 [Secundilactobacillus kimchicus JCM 15530]|uniref:Phospholipase/carboxylesterase/thioesterase domain-containing protein n=1 Tax=Secundilactobacillus kimchicus JCM 15530 TaxID=1302272 RepID=A0A0R1HM52_9LACO|nr:alpha/beta hydrolase [Secundilactobacillus kimchicus]KRK47648.1 hypothetical protein FC96_GL002371 [Secundilactobacillus kimchicus JCM 15530]